MIAAIRIVAVLLAMMPLSIAGDDLVRGMIVPKNMFDYHSEVKEEVRHVRYKVRIEYPAQGLIENYKKRLHESGWTPLNHDFLNPDIPSSHVRGWTEHEDQTTHPTTDVRQWLSQWQDSQGNVVSYLLRYTTPLGSQEHFNDELTVSISYFPLHIVKALQSAVVGGKAPQTVPYHAATKEALDRDKLNLALRAAAENGDIVWTKNLLSRGADADASDSLNFSALMAAAMNGHNEIVEMLIKQGADVNAKGDKGITALMVASQNGHTEVVRLLIEKGADLNARCCGNTALSLARKNGHTDIANLLIKAGAK